MGQSCQNRTEDECSCFWPWQYECVDVKDCYDICSDEMVSPCTTKTRCFGEIDWSLIQSRFVCRCGGCEGRTKADQEFLDACEGQCPDDLEICYYKGYRWLRDYMLYS